MERLLTALDRAANGVARAVLITGALGVGKSRLAHELSQIAVSRGHLVLASRAYPGDAHLAYAPIISALAPYVRGLDSARRAELRSSLPHLFRLWDGRPPADQGAPEQVHLFDNVCCLLEEAAREQPVLWIMDDLHLADPGSVALFYYLARHMRQHRVLLLATYRNDEADALRHLGAPLLTLVRHGLAEQVELEPLAPAQVAELVSRRLGSKPAPSLLAYLNARTMGTPLIVLSLLDSLADQGLLSEVGGAVRLRPDAGHFPALAGREVMLERIGRLTAPQRRVLDFLAVMSGNAERDELAQALGSERTDLLAVLAELQSTGVIEAQVSPSDASVQVRLVHPLLQEVLYAELPSLVRRNMHAQVAAVLERQTPVPLQRLARQYEGSGGEPDPERATQVLLAAGDQLEHLEGAERVHYYRVALALLRGAQTHHASPLLLSAVLLRLGQALALNGELDAARARLLEALEITQTHGDAQQIGAMHAHVAWVDVMLGDLDATESHIRSGMTHLRPYGWSPDLLYLHGLTCNLHLLRSDIPAVSQDAADLAEAALALDTPSARAWHLHARFWAELLSAQVETALGTARDGLGQAWLSRDPKLVMILVLDLACLLVLRGELQQAAAELRSTLARLPGSSVLLAHHLLGPVLATTETLLGRWDAGMQISDDGATLEPFVHGFPGANLGARALIHIRRGDLAAARACLDEASARRRPFVTEWEYAEALFALETGDHAQAAAVAATLQTWALSPLGFAVLAEAQVALGDLDAARGTVAILQALGSLGLPLAAALGAWANGLAERMAGEHDTATTAFASAADQFKQLRMPFDAARAQFEHAQLLAASDRRSASDLARQALQGFTLLGADTWAENVRRWRAGQAPRREVRNHKPDVPFTAREIEIIRLLDQGLTTTQIAGRLVLSPRTVSNHLDRMYTRHGVRNRLTLVRFAREAGVL